MMGRPVTERAGNVATDRITARDAVPLLLRTCDLEQHGIMASQIPQKVANRDLVRVRTGVFLPAWVVDALAPWDKDLVALHAQALASRARSPFIYASAARLWGLDVWNVSTEIHVAQRGIAAPSAYGAQVVRHIVRLRPEDEGRPQGLRATHMARTVADCLRVLEWPQAVILADSALRMGLGRQEVADQLAGQAGARGRRRGASALSMADGRSESVAEGRMRIRLHQWGIPPPVLQHEVVVAGRRYRLDFAWPDAGLALEVHGNGKYFMESPIGEKLLQERKREAQLAEAGISVLNIWWEQLGQPDLRARIERHLAPLLLRNPRM